MLYWLGSHQELELSSKRSGLKGTETSLSWNVNLTRCRRCVCCHREFLDGHQAEMDFLSSQQRETKRNSRLVRRGGEGACSKYVFMFLWRCLLVSQEREIGESLQIWHRRSLGFKDWTDLTHVVRGSKVKITVTPWISGAAFHQTSELGFIVPMFNVTLHNYHTFSHKCRTG